MTTTPTGALPMPSDGMRAAIGQLSVRCCRTGEDHGLCEHQPVQPHG